MTRTKITAYVTPDIAEALKRLAAISNRSVSDIVEDTIMHRLNESGREAEHAALMGKIDRILRRLGVLEKSLETHFHLTEQSARFAVSLAPEIRETDRNTRNARGADYQRCSDSRPVRRSKST